MLLLLALDLGVFHRHAHVVSFRESLGWSMVWVTLALAFNYGALPLRRVAFGAEVGQPLGLEFLTGYLVEKSLAIDNIFVFVLVFAYFGDSGAVPAPGALLRHRRRAGLPRDLHRARLGADAVPTRWCSSSARS